MKKLLPYLFFLFSSLLSFSQGYTLEHYTMLNGLPSNDVKKITIDSKGYLWGLTENGLFRYDGTKFNYFQSEEKLYIGYTFDSGEGMPGVISIDNRSFKALPNGRIVFSTMDSTYTFQNGRYGKASPSPEIKKIVQNNKGKTTITKVSSGAMDKDGNEWFSSDHVYCFDGKKTKTFGVKDGLCADSLIVSGESFMKGFTKFFLHSVNIDNKGMPWIFSKNAAYKFNGKSFDKINIALKFPCVDVFEDSKGRVWFQTFATSLTLKIPSVVAIHILFSESTTT